ncbi:unnamed protein product [Rotaria magnacalcarata]|uniref:MRH domain-containing protein n=2 Tax=Rotaria magnacalcarata TaxID=392030 RepID=A0A816CLE9_9BILA|nr:unnamed protein product [Rotaria magnacalcarata]
MMSWFKIFTIFIAFSSVTIADDPCRYQTDKGVIDLSSLARTDNKPQYPDKVPAAGSGYKYSYNPCKSFTELPSCQGVAGCQVSTDGKYSFSIGKQESAKWNPGGIGGSPSVTYTDGPKTLVVTLVCAKDGTDELEPLGEATTNNYKMRLTNKCACWDGCGGTPPTPPPPPQRNCSIDGHEYTSDKEIIQSTLLDITINPSQLSPPTSSYAVVDKYGIVLELHLIGIDDIPSAFFCLQSLQVLSIIGCANLSIPSELLLLADTLTSFIVANISTPLILPPELFNMTILSTLSIMNSNLTTLSEDIINLAQLTELTLDQNQLTSLPTALGKMASLKRLSVSNNLRLASLNALTGSKSLITLQGSHCIITDLPTNISSLSTIELNNNLLTSLDELNIIASNSTISMSFANNSINSISNDFFNNIQTIKYLDLSGNQLSKLPASIYPAKGFEILNLHNNSFGHQETEWVTGIFRPTNTTVIM